LGLRSLAPSFYPAGLPKTKQLEYASRQLTAIEVNATYYKLQKPELFERWAKTVPDGFKFAVKASRFCTNRKVLGEGGEGVEKFCAQGLSSLATGWGRSCGSSWAPSSSIPTTFRLS
jgi:uncharacterized protein YecE (DUF72 family)